MIIESSKLFRGKGDDGDEISQISSSTLIFLVVHTCPSFSCYIMVFFLKFS